MKSEHVLHIISFEQLMSFEQMTVIKRYKRL